MRLYLVRGLALGQHALWRLRFLLGIGYQVSINQPAFASVVQKKPVDNSAVLVPSSSTFASFWEEAGANEPAFDKDFDQALQAAASAKALTEDLPVSASLLQPLTETLVSEVVEHPVLEVELAYPASAYPNAILEPTAHSFEERVAQLKAGLLDVPQVAIKPSQSPTIPTKEVETEPIAASIVLAPPKSPKPNAIPASLAQVKPQHNAHTPMAQAAKIAMPPAKPQAMPTSKILSVQSGQHITALEYERPPREMSNWAFTLIALVVLAVSIGSFFV